MSLENRVPSTNTKCGQIRIVSRLFNVPSCCHLIFPVLLLNQPTMWHLVMPIQSSQNVMMQLQLTCIQLLLPTDIRPSSEGFLEEYSMFHHMGCQFFDSPFTVLHLVWKYILPHFLEYSVGMSLWYYPDLYKIEDPFNMKNCNNSYCGFPLCAGNSGNRFTRHNLSCTVVLFSFACRF